jgi:two-component system nitrate/nitrite response regulator NarL
MQSKDREASGNSGATAVLIADANRMDCQLLADAVQRNGQLRIVGCATSSGEVLSSVRANRPDVAVISARLPGGAFSGLQLTRELHKLRLGIRIVVVIDADEHELVVDAFRSGARGVFCRTESSKELRKCIQRVHEGQIWANSAQMERIVDALMQTPKLGAMYSKDISVLSKREEQVCRLAAVGLSNREISSKLGLSEHTVKNYLFKIFNKLGISTRIELVLYALSQSKRPVSAGRDALQPSSDKFSA